MEALGCGAVCPGRATTDNSGGGRQDQERHGHPSAESSRYSAAAPDLKGETAAVADGQGESTRMRGDVKREKNRRPLAGGASTASRKKKRIRADDSNFVSGSDGVGDGEETATPMDLDDDIVDQLCKMDDGTFDRECVELMYRYTQQLNFGPFYDEDFGCEYDQPQLTEVNERLALYRKKDYELCSEQNELDIKELKDQYPPGILHEEGYFEYLEKDLEWFFHPKYCKLSSLDDYQRLVLRNDDYFEWKTYISTYHTFEADMQFVCFCDEISKETKWIEEKADPGNDQWRRYKDTAFIQVLQIAKRHPKIFSNVVHLGFQEYMWTLEMDFSYRWEFNRLYLEISELVAKQKMNFEDALMQLYEQGLLRSSRPYVVGVLGNQKLTTEIKNDFYAWMARIDDEVSENNAHILFLENQGWKPKLYLDYARKKVEVARRIGLIPKGEGAAPE